MGPPRLPSPQGPHTRHPTPRPSSPQGLRTWHPVPGAVVTPGSPYLAPRATTTPRFPARRTPRPGRCHPKGPCTQHPRPSSPRGPRSQHPGPGQRSPRGPQRAVGWQGRHGRASCSSSGAKTSRGRGAKWAQERSPPSPSPFPVAPRFPPSLDHVFHLFLHFVIVPRPPWYPCPRSIRLRPGTRAGMLSGIRDLSPPKSCCHPCLACLPGWGWPPTDPSPLRHGGHCAPPVPGWHLSGWARRCGEAAKAPAPRRRLLLEVLRWERRGWGQRGGGQSPNRVEKRKGDSRHPSGAPPIPKDA